MRQWSACGPRFDNGRAARQGSPSFLCREARGAARNERAAGRRTVARTLVLALLAATPALLSRADDGAPAGAAATKVVTPWHKRCAGRVGDAGQDACVTAITACFPGSRVVGAAALIERGGGQTAVLRVIVPYGARLVDGVQVSIDDQPGPGASISMCSALGCRADIVASRDVVDALRAGASLRVHATDMAGKFSDMVVPLVDFAAVADGPGDSRPAGHLPDPLWDDAPAAPPAGKISPVSWRKFCGVDHTRPGAATVCLTVAEVRLDSGPYVGGVALIESEGRKLLRVTLPLRIDVTRPADIAVDGDRLVTTPYSACLPYGCMADADVRADMLRRLTGGRVLSLRGFDRSGKADVITFSLTDFARVNAGPPVDPAALEEEQRKLREALAKQAPRPRLPLSPPICE
jgi:invasion protein IalB